MFLMFYYLENSEKMQNLSIYPMVSFIWHSIDY